MRWLFSLLLLLGAAGLCQGAPQPLTAKDVGLMLRSGYSSTTVMQELRQRHFADTLDAEKETALLKAGAVQGLIDALKSGTYTLSPKELAEAQAQFVRQNARSSLQADQARKAEAARQAQVLRERATPGSAGANVLVGALQGNLVRFYNGAVVHDDGVDLSGKKMIALYFSAHWCGPCRKFTPQLVEFYNRVAQLHPEFEIVFVSSDRSASAMEGYMSEANMPWPAIEFAKIAGKPEITKYAGTGIPCLVLLDASGKVLSDTFAGKEYLGPRKVLTDIDAIFAGNQVAQSR